MFSKLVAFLVAVLFVAGLVGGGVYVAAGEPSAQVVTPAKENTTPGGCC